MGLSRLLLLLLSLIASAAVSTFSAQSGSAPPACDLSTVAPKLARHCQSDPDVPSFLLSPTAQCCEALGASLPAQQEAALPCLCRAAADPRLITASLDATRLFALYRGCGKGSFDRGLDFADWYCEVEKTGDNVTALCGAANLATKVLRFCVIDKRIEECCMAVVPAVSLKGRPPCLCRVAAEPQLAAAGLNLTGIVALYAGPCGGRYPVPVDACKGWHLPAPVLAHQGAAAAAVLAPTMAALAAASPSCTPRTLASAMVLYVLSDRTAQSCKGLVYSVDLGGGVPCLCRTAGEYVAISAGLKATDLLAIYNSCGGLRLGGAGHKAAAASCDGMLSALRVLLEDTLLCFSSPETVHLFWVVPPPTPPQKHDGGAIRIGPDTVTETATA